MKAKKHYRSLFIHVTQGTEINHVSLKDGWASRSWTVLEFNIPAEFPITNIDIIRDTAFRLGVSFTDYTLVLKCQ